MAITYDQFATQIAANDQGDTTWPPYSGGLPPLHQPPPPPPRATMDNQRAQETAFLDKHNERWLTFYLKAGMDEQEARIEAAKSSAQTFIHHFQMTQA